MTVTSTDWREGAQSRIITEYDTRLGMWSDYAAALPPADVARFRQYYWGKIGAEAGSSVTQAIPNMATVSLPLLKPIVDSYTSRLWLRGVATDNDALADALTRWRQRNRLDALQAEAHRAALIDGEGYIICDWVNDQPRWRAERAFDGHYGIVPAYSDGQLAAAARVWRDASQTIVTVYTADKITRWRNGQPEELPWRPGVLPVVALMAAPADGRGVSLLHTLTPVQDIINALARDLLASAAMAGMPMYIEAGSNIVTSVAPGQVVQLPIGATLTKMEASSPAPAVDQLAFFIGQLHELAFVPTPAAATASGEAQRQRRALLAGAIAGLQTTFGNSWEDVMRVSAAMHNTFSASAKLDAEATLTALWAEPDPDPDTEVIKASLAARGVLPDAAILSIIADEMGLDGDALAAQVRAAEAEADQRLMSIIEAAPIAPITPRSVTPA